MMPNNPGGSFGEMGQGKKNPFVGFVNPHFGFLRKKVH
jgi:hypothetical protein